MFELPSCEVPVIHSSAFSEFIDNFQDVDSILKGIDALKDKFLKLKTDGAIFSKLPWLSLEFGDLSPGDVVEEIYYTLPGHVRKVPLGWRDDFLNCTVCSYAVSDKDVAGSFLMTKDELLHEFCWKIYETLNKSIGVDYEYIEDVDMYTYTSDLFRVSSYYIFYSLFKQLNRRDRLRILKNLNKNPDKIETLPIILDSYIKINGISSVDTKFLISIAAAHRK